MRANKAHLEAEFAKGRIKGTEYADVYLGSVTQVLQTALAFLLARDKANLEAQLIQKQIDLAQAQIDHTAAQKAQVEAQTLLVNQQKVNLIAEAINIPKQGLLIDAQKDTQVSQKAHIDAQTLLVGQQKTNAIQEHEVLVAQECKLQAEFDNIQAATTRIGQETALMTQKVATERAQTLATGVDSDSVVGRQKGLYLAQTNGFTRDAEQKAAKTMIDTWNVRKTTDTDGTEANPAHVGDAYIARAVDKLLNGIGA